MIPSKRTFVVLCVILFNLTMYAQMNNTLSNQKSDDEILTELFRNSYGFYQKIRHTNGAYFDMFKLEGTTDRGSVANIGMGLMSLCVGHEMGWEPDAEAMVLQTLKTVVDGTNEFYLSRNAKGCFIHFYDINTGAARGTNYSPIDTDLLLGGALFAKRYFHNNNEIASYVDNLFNSVDHSVFVGDVNAGQIALSMNLNGTPSGSWTLPYNEYMIVAWFAKNQSPESDSPANQLWEKHYSSPENLKQCVYPGKNGTNYPVIAPSYYRFTTMFTFMFNHNFVHSFSFDPEYQEAMLMAMKADSAWWADRTELEVYGKQPYEWGTGAGVGAPDSKYSVDRICLPQNVNTDKDQNPNRNVSPHILAGFAPVAPERVRTDILAMYKDPRKIGQIELEPGKPILWKYSYIDLNWKPNKVEGVDYSCMVFGLAALPQFLGPEFFQVYNDFFNPETPVYDKVTSAKTILKNSVISVYPNPANTKIHIKGTQFYDCKELVILNVNGSIVQRISESEYGSTLNVEQLNQGTYIIRLVKKSGEVYTGKFMKL